MNRRKRAIGIRANGQGVWEINITLGRDSATRKQRRFYVTFRGTLTEAKQERVRLLHERDQGFDQPLGKLAVGDYLARWLEEMKPNWAAKTALRYGEIVRLHIAPIIGDIELRKLRPIDVPPIYRRAQEQGLSTRTVLHIHRVLRAALQQAVRLELVNRNACDAVQAPRPDRYEHRALNPEELRRVLAAADSTRYGCLIYLAAATGLRLGELNGLRYQDLSLDSDNATLQVRQTCQWLPGQGFIFREPKTAGSRRSVALSPDAVERLRVHRRAQLEERLAAGPAYADQDDLVFADPLGRPIQLTPFRRVWATIIEEAGVGHLRLHDLRHSHASILMAANVHPKVVSERLGHSRVSITLDTYSHTIPSLQADAAEQFDRVLAQG